MIQIKTTDEFADMKLWKGKPQTINNRNYPSSSSDMKRKVAS